MHRMKCHRLVFRLLPSMALLVSGIVINVSAAMSREDASATRASAPIVIRNRDEMQAFIESTQQHLTGDVRVRISAGLAQITGRRSPFSLYDDGLATYSDGDTFDRTAAVGFSKLFGLSYQTLGRVQRTR